jgi:hypothetical protein
MIEGIDKMFNNKSFPFFMDIWCQNGLQHPALFIDIGVNCFKSNWIFLGFIV